MGMMQLVMQYNDDPTDAYRLAMPSIFKQAEESILDLVALRDTAKEKYSDLLVWLNIKAMKTDELFLLFDNFFVPSQLILNSSEKVRKEVLLPRFCRGKPACRQDLMILWGFSVAEEPRKPSPIRKRQTA